MKANKKTVIAIVLIVLATVLVFLSVSQAKEIELEEAVNWGIHYNYDLQKIRYDIETFERELEILDAGEALQVNLEVSPLFAFSGEESSDSTEDSTLSSTNDESNLVSITAEKAISDDLNISAEVSWQQSALSEMSFEGIVENANAVIQIDKQIYPISWSEKEQQVFQTKNNLQMKIEELTWEEAEKQIDFITDYLTITQSIAETNLADQKYQQAKRELEWVQQQINLGEGSTQQEIEAKLALMEADNQLFSLKQNLIQQKQEWYLKLGLSKDIQVQFKEEPVYLKSLRANMEQLKLETEKKEIFFNQAIENHYQIKIGYLEKDILLKEAELTKNEGKPTIGISGGYDFTDQYWYSMANLSWNVTDGGTQRLKEEDCEATIFQKEKEINQLTEELQLEMNQLVDQDQYNQLNLQTKLLSLEEEQHIKEVIEKQYQEGIIPSTTWQNQLITLAEKELEVKKAQD